MKDKKTEINATESVVTHISIRGIELFDITRDSEKDQIKIEPHFREYAYMKNEEFKCLIATLSNIASAMDHELEFKLE